MSGLDVLILDPGNYTPYYDINLSCALIEQGWNVEWGTSSYLFETIESPPNLRTRILFFRSLSKLFSHVPKIRHLTALRQFIKALSYPFDLIRLDKELGSRYPGILHVQWALFPFLDSLFWKRWRKKGWRIIYTAHDLAGLLGTTPRIFRNANRHLFRIADGIITHSQRDRENILHLGLPQACVDHIPQGGPGIFQTRDVSKVQARTELGIETNRPTILFFGLLKPYKGLNVLLQSLAIVRAQIPQVLLMIVGESLMPRREYEGMIQGFGKNIYWEPSYIPSQRAGLYFSAADVVALPYLAASSSAVLLNACFRTRPVVATNVGGLPEMIEHNKTGLVVPPADPNALANALASILSDLGRGETMGKYAREYALKHHSWDLIAELTGHLYRATM